MSNVFTKNTTGVKIFMNFVEDSTKIEDQEQLSSLIVALRDKLEGTGVTIEAYIGKDGNPIVELR